jgi:peroxiredoxin
MQGSLAVCQKSSSTTLPRRSERETDRDDASNKMGTIYAYDGITVRRISPSSKEFLVAEPEQFGSMLITGNWLGQLIQTPLNGDSLLKKVIAEGEHFQYEGIEEIESVPCHVVSVESPASEHFSQSRTVWYISTEDYLPRKRVGENVYNGVRLEDGMTLHELNVNPALPDNLFFLSVPDGYTVAHYEKFPKPLATGMAAPEWTLFDASSRSVSLSDLRGNVVLLDFWHTASDPCIMTMPMIQKLHDRFKDRGVIVYGITIPAGGSMDATRMMQHQGYTYGLLLNGGEAGRSYNFLGWPTVYLIGDDGIILFSRAGRIGEDEEKLTDIIENYLHERGR